MRATLENKSHYSREEYLRLEERSEYKSEYYKGEIFAMSGGSIRHSMICVNLIRRLAAALDDKDCTVLDSNMKLEIPQASAFVYPDVMVVCGKIESPEGRTDIVNNPVLITEVLSPSTQAFDRSEKFSFYRTLSSLKEYVLISQQEPLVEVFYKHDEKNWMFTVSKGLEDIAELRSVAYELALKKIYHKILF